MEAEGISKFWKMNPMANRPMTSTVQMEARASRGVSAGSSLAEGEGSTGSVIGVAVEFMGLVSVSRRKCFSAEDAYVVKSSDDAGKKSS